MGEATRRTCILCLLKNLRGSICEYRLCLVFFADPAALYAILGCVLVPSMEEISSAQDKTAHRSILPLRTAHGHCAAIPRRGPNRISLKPPARGASIYLIWDMRWRAGIIPAALKDFACWQRYSRFKSISKCLDSLDSRDGNASCEA